MQGGPRRYPEFPIRTGIYSWEDYLPPFSSRLRKLVEAYEAAAEIDSLTH